MKKYFPIALISLLLGVFIAGFIFFYSPEKNTSDNFSEDPSTFLSSSLYASSSTLQKEKLNFVQVAEKIAPAVVKIESERVEKRTITGFSDEWPFEDFWDRFFGTPQGREQEFHSTAQGSGFFISPDGYILTNNHLVEKAIKVTIFTRKGEELKAKIIGADPASDLALLKIDKDNLPFANLGDSAQLKVGEWVLAIGNPFGLSHTVTAGIVSAKGRELSASNVPSYQDYIQTDASINRGNSGGPLVNMNGNVIGINTIIISPTGGNIGIGFATPSNLAKKVIKQLKEKGRVIRGYLGVSITPVTEDARKLLKLESLNGALVNSVEPGTPAEKAGFKRYDVITKINGEPVKNYKDASYKIADTPPGEKINLTIIRDGKEKSILVKVVEKESEETSVSQFTPGEGIGISVRELTPSIARRYGYRTTQGVIITEVRRYSEAEKKGLKAGDIILEINTNKVRKIRDLQNVLKNAKPGDPIMLGIRRETNREAKEFIVTLRIPE